MSTATSSRRSYHGYGFNVDVPVAEWPAVENIALVVVVGDRHRPGGRKLLRRFIGRRPLKRVLEQLRGRWILLAVGHGGVTATDAHDLDELKSRHRDVFVASRIVRGHIEIFHGIDPETRAALIAAGKQFDLQLAPARGAA